MTVTRVIAAAAMLAGLAIGTASTAWAAPTMSGHYVMTDTDPVSGQSTTNDWYFTPCGDGCASLGFKGRSPEQARLVSGQWTLDSTGDTTCSDGTHVPDAYSDHFTWDPNTLAGKVRITARVAECGNPAGSTFTDNIQLRQAP
jgi:hypothetical protein